VAKNRLLIRRLRAASSISVRYQTEKVARTRGLAGERIIYFRVSNVA